jgi:hypothetical protein
VAKVQREHVERGEAQRVCRFIFAWLGGEQHIRRGQILSITTAQGRASIRGSSSWKVATTGTNLI